MNEIMVYGCQIFKNATNGSTFPNNYQIDNSQLSLFRLRHDSIVARNDAGDRYWYWLRDVVSSTGFADVSLTMVSSFSSPFREGRAENTCVLPKSSIGRPCSSRHFR